MNENTPQTTTLLPPVGQLFSDSFSLLKKAILNLFLLNLLGFGIGVGVLLILVILGIILGAGSYFTQGPEAFSNPAQILPFIASFGIIIAIGVVVAIVISLAFQIANIMVIDQEYKTSEVQENKLNVFQILKKSFPYILPFVIVSFVGGLLTFGSLFLLIVPAIVISILFSFSIFEVVLSNQRGLAPLKRSFLIVASNFWGIAGRIILLWLVGFVISIVISIITPKESELNGLFSLLGMVVNAIFGWFSACYTYLLYKEASQGLENQSGKSLLPIVITSIVGWVLGILIMFSAVKTIGTFMSNPEIQRDLQEGLKDQQDTSEYTPPSENPSMELEEYMDPEALEQMMQDQTQDQIN